MCKFIHFLNNNNNVYCYIQIEIFTCFDSYWKENKKLLHKIMHYDNTLKDVYKLIKRTYIFVLVPSYKMIIFTQW